MMIAFPVEEYRGLESQIYGHFGSAPSFLLLDSETMAVENLTNADQNHIHGMCSPMKALAGRKVDAVVVGGIGMGASTDLKWPESRSTGPASAPWPTWPGHQGRYFGRIQRGQHLRGPRWRRILPLLPLRVVQKERSRFPARRMAAKDSGSEKTSGETLFQRVLPRTPFPNGFTGPASRGGDRVVPYRSSPDSKMPRPHK
jgi:hypothetical protein